MSAAPPSPKPNVKSLSCPNCGGTVQVRGMGRAATVVCIQCLSVLDATSPSLKVLQTFQSAERYQPLIPLGTRGKMRGDPYEVIGFQVRKLMADGVAYHWSEYVLFNPYKGFRYLSEYNGHWNDITTIKGVPLGVEDKGHRSLMHLGTTYKHFQHYTAVTVYVMGEFPWQVRVGESAVCDDYIQPPFLLSSEKTENESSWSIGEYTPGATIWQNFGLKGSPPESVGVFANQPSNKSGEVAKAWKKWLFWTAALFVLQMFWSTFDSDRKVFQETYTFQPQVATAGTGQSEHSFVTPVFELGGRTSSVQVEINTNLENSGAFFNLALINTDNGKAFDFSRQVSYYNGRDEDGSWSEGRNRDTVVLPSVEPGKYYLRVEPEAEPGASKAVRYQITVRRDVPTWGFFVIGALLLLVPPIWTSLRSGSFESKRWAESDYGGGSSGSSSSSDDD